MAVRPLQGFPVAHSSSPGSLRDAVDKLTNYDHTVKRSTDLKFVDHGTVNGLKLDSVSLVYVAYATPVSVFAPPTRDQVILVVPLGPMRVETGSGSDTLTTPYILSANSETTMHPDPNAGALVGSVSIEALLEMLGESFGHDRSFLIDLDQNRPIPVGSQLAVRRTWLDFAADPHSGEQDDLIDSLAIGLVPFTNYKTDELADWQRPPEYLLAAIRYMRRNFAEQLSLADLSDRVGIGDRQLQLAFRAHMMCTAQDYLKSVRLDEARQLLLLAGKGRAVADIGAEVGLPHQGRFGQYFSERFGVLPSQFKASGLKNKS